MAPVGSVIAGYRVERVLGTGGMGAVYLVANPELPRRDALKVLSAGLSRDQQFRSRFKREADVASQLDHPNIVSIYRRGETRDGLLWIAMQFVDGVNADEALQGGPMEPQRAIHIVGEVGKALDYAHQRGVIHRDVKPANVLLSGPPGPNERVLLGDFGIARALDDVGLTGTGGVMATVSYAAPEVITGGRVDGRADLYSLGCTLFRLLSGRSPFAGAGAQAAVMMAHLQSPPPRISEMAPWLPPALDAVMAKALAKDPAQRYASGAELAAAARSALHGGGPVLHGGGPVLHGGGPPGWQPVVSAGAGRSRRGPLIAALTGVALLVVAGVTAVVLTNGSSPADSGDRSADQSSPAPTTGTAAATSPTSKRPVPVAALPDLLLNPAELSSTLGSPPLTLVNDETAMWDDTIADKDCNSVVIVNSRSDYAGSGYTAIRWQGAKDTKDDNFTWDVGQTVVAFPQAADAQAYVDRATKVWRACANRTVNVRPSKDTGPATLWQLGPVDYGDGIMSTVRTPAGPGNWMCEEGLSARDNVAIRAWVCHANPDTMLVRKVIQAIEGKVDTRG